MIFLAPPLSVHVRGGVGYHFVLKTKDPITSMITN